MLFEPNPDKLGFAIMNTKIFSVGKVILISGLLLVGMIACTKDQIDSVLNSNVSDAEVVAGLKSALQVGTDTSVSRTNRKDGYFTNAAIKILLPPEAQEAARYLNNIGLQSYVDNAILSINRAAEDAASEAKPIFIDAITSITITDGKNILFGDSIAATSYLKTKTYVNLKSIYKPRIKTSLDKVSATKYYGDFADKYNSIAVFTGKDTINSDLTDYTTGKALDGLFYVVSQQEKDIRKDPVARVTDILKKVFGQLDKK